LRKIVGTIIEVVTDESGRPSKSKYQVTAQPENWGSGIAANFSSRKLPTGAVSAIPKLVARVGEGLVADVSS